MFSLHIFVSFFLCSCIISIECDYPLIATKQGHLRGVSLKSRNGSKYLAFYGIPFAKPPVGELRFESPQEPDSWDGIRDATLPPPQCTQTNIFGPDVTPATINVEGQEDCLYLNVYSPNELMNPLPTLVYIHGGGFLAGSASRHDPLYFMDYPVVIVIIQYRLNVFGFLSAADEVLPGNYGMKDQVAALKWVQQNIAAFGGDPKRVTIMGESAGAASVHLHMHSPLSKGTFQQAISQSGSALSCWAQILPQVARKRAHAFATLSGCPTEPTSALLKCLRKIPEHELIQTHQKFYVWDFEPIIPFSIVVESDRVKDAFLINNPWMQDIISDVPWITGLVSHEGLVMASRFLVRPELLEYFDSHYQRFFPMNFYYDERFDGETASQVTEAIRKFYFGNESMSKNGDKLIDLYTDGYFAVSTIEAARRRGQSKVYFYLYDHRNVHTFNEIFMGYAREDKYVSHVDDLISLFHLVSVFPKITDGPDLVVSQKMVKYWINFIYTGDPNGIEGVWKSVQSHDIEYLHIRTETDVMEKNLPTEEYTFWKSLPVFYSYKSQSEDLEVAKEEL